LDGVLDKTEDDTLIDELMPKDRNRWWPVRDKPSRDWTTKSIAKEFTASGAPSAI
jgi:hypothetical protein